MVRAALHVHSTYSDGEFALAELRDKFLAAGCRVVAMADHADAFDGNATARYVEECARLSDDRLLFIPGLEFGCAQRMHVVGYGVTALIDSTDPETIFAHIRRNGGVSVIAHPPNALFATIESFSLLPDGVEGWNSKYDGRYAPRPETFALIGRLRMRANTVRTFYGQDLHWRKQYSGLYTRLDAPVVTREAILRAMATGEFFGEKDNEQLPSNGLLSSDQLIRFTSVSERTRHFRSLVKRARLFAGKVVDYLPKSIKDQLRRIF